ncbi:MAG: ferritin-like domain-containing protein [Nitrospirae bacterium]|nr:ferritin-like domain-containing protein [Candidatus Manganitrophaceae bacterium]
MDMKQVLQVLNQALQIEYASTIQYLQHSFLVQGIDRKMYADFFRDRSRNAFNQAREIGEHIVTLGGVPSVEGYPIKQSAELKEMLQFDLELERSGLQIYQEGVEAAGNHSPLKFFFETQAYQTYQDIGEIEKLLERKRLFLSEGEVQLKKARIA